MIAVLLIVLSIITLFIFCSLKLASESDREELN